MDSDFVTILADLPVTLRTVMHLRRKSLRDVAQETNLSHTAVDRVLIGTAATDTLNAICTWIAGPE